MEIVLMLLFCAICIEFLVNKLSIANIAASVHVRNKYEEDYLNAATKEEREDVFVSYWLFNDSRK